MRSLTSRDIPFHNDARWFNNNIRAAKQQRLQIERLWRSSGLAIHRKMFIAEKNHVTHLINVAKEKNYKEQVAVCATISNFFDRQEIEA